MKNKIPTIVFIAVCIILTTLAFSLVKTSDANRPATVDLTVQVNDAIYDYPIEGAEVTANGNNSYIEYTNENGQAFFNGIPNDTYCVDAFYRNFKGYEDSLYLADSTYFLIIYISENDSLCP